MKNLNSKILLKICILLPSAFMLLTMGSCTRFYYAGTPHHHALLQNKNEVVIAGGVGIADETNFGNVNAAFALGDHFGIYGQYYSARHNSSQKSLGNGSYGDLGLGYYGGFKNPRWRYEIIAAYGTGRVNNYFDSGTSIKNQFTKPYLQGNFGYRHDIFCFGVSLRTAYINQEKVDVYSTSTLPPPSQVSDLSNNRTHMAFEPGIYISGAFTNIKLQLGYSICSLSPIGNSTKSYSYQDGFFSAGLRINFNVSK